MRKIRQSLIMAVAAGALLAAAIPAREARANALLWSQEIGGLNIPGVYPSPKGAATSATSIGSGATGTATMNTLLGTVTTPSLTTAAGSTYTLTLTDPMIAAGDVVLPVVGNGSNTGGTPAVANATVSSGQVVVTVQNIHASAAFNGTITVGVYVLKLALPQ